MSPARAARPWVIAGATLTTLNGLAAWTWPTLPTLTAIVGASLVFAVVHSLSTGPASGRLIREPKTRTTAGEQQVNAGGERCCVCGGLDTPYENYRGQLFCWPCANCGCGQDRCVRTGINGPAVDEPGPAAPDVAHPSTEQPVSGPQQVDESTPDGGPVVQATTTVPLDWTGAGRTFTDTIRTHTTHQENPRG
ncbi:hypothetical protein [Streptomyces sp. CA-111067]|uniref:hypothetical protein n=1 Tax=Streptomyces sp. CA-111067 TaxID=3240046 RepID=UPI003D957CBA